MKKVRVVAIDPGKTGSVACTDFEMDGTTVVKRRHVGLHDIKTFTAAGRFEFIDGADLNAAIKSFAPDVIFIEHVGSIGNEGRNSLWTFAQGFGTILLAAQMVTNNIHLERPVDWKRRMRLSSDKIECVMRAIALYPELKPALIQSDSFKSGKPKKDRIRHDRAEAILMTEFYAAHIHGRKEVAFC